MNNPVSNGAKSLIQGRSSSRIEAAIANALKTDARIESTNKDFTYENITNHKRSSNRARNSIE